MSRNPTFIDEIADALVADFGYDMGSVTLIFPNKRAGLFLQRALVQKTGQPVWAPRVYSLEDFLYGYTHFKPADKLTLVLELYGAYSQVNPQPERLEKFFFWGEMLVSDFEDIDQYLIEPGHLFRSIQTQQELNQAFAYLGEEERRVIQSFWKSFMPKPHGDQVSFLQTWQMLLPVYSNFIARLQAKGLAYKGMVYRSLADACKNNRFDPGSSGSHFWLAGFNVLTPAEETIFKYLVQERGARIFWDVDDYYVSSEMQESGRFFRQYQKDSVLGRTFPETFPQNFEKPKQIEIVSVSLEMGQAGYVGERLEELAAGPAWAPEEAVVVLPMEHFLFPMLSAIPEAIEQVNVTMGYPLKDTPLFSLLDAVFDLRKNSRKKKEGDEVQELYSYREVLSVLRHPYVYGYAPQEVGRRIGDIESNNIIYHTREDFAEASPLLKALFYHTQGSPLDQLIGLLELLHEQMGAESSEQDEPEIEKEYITLFYDHLSGLRTALAGVEATEVTFFQKLFRKVAQAVRVPFSGEPLRGLQIMGVLETRNLDFRHVFVPGMNEGYWPVETSARSFIPYNLRRGFGLPTFHQQDASYSYLFYRLIQRAEKVTFLYNTSNEANLKGEISRLLLQLKYETGHGNSIIYKSLSGNVVIGLPTAITIEKTAEVMNRLGEYMVINAPQAAKDRLAQARLSPSALNTYLDCRLRFYFRYLAGLKEPAEVQAEPDPAAFGNILHQTLEILYKDFIAKKGSPAIDKSDFERLRKQVPHALQKGFDMHHVRENGREMKLEGQNLIALSIARRLTMEILSNDENYAPFEILGLELDELTLDLPIDSSRTVALKGVIDRVDKKDDLIRVLDYKSGADNKVFYGIDSLFDRNNPKRNKAALQTFYYGMLYMSRYPLAGNTKLLAGLYNSRDLFTRHFSVELRLKDQSQRDSGTPISDITPFIEEFSSGLKALFLEIFDPAIPFDQTQDTKKCTHCPYRNICHRE